MGHDDDMDDEALWAKEMRDVKPLEPGRKPRPAAKAPKSKDFAPSVPPIPAPPPKPDRAKKELPGKGLDRRTDEKLRKGQMPIEGRLDLHGLRQNEAKAALEAFIGEAYAAGKRCILVITGKGKTKAGGDFWAEDGVLKAAVPDWLALPGLQHYILKIAPARPHHGGSGALYILLRRRR